jgi:hypothetical protein
MVNTAVNMAAALAGSVTQGLNKLKVMAVAGGGSGACV